jgi:hypothetical protein
MVWFLSSVLTIATAVAAYAVARHKQDWQVAFGIAAAVAVIALIFSRGGYIELAKLLDAYTSPAKIADEYAKVFGFGTTVAFIGFGVFFGLIGAAVASRLEWQAEEARKSPGALNQAEARKPPEAPATNPQIRPPESSSSPQERPAPDPPGVQTTNPLANETPAAEQRLTFCPACHQIFYAEKRSDITCPYCGAALGRAF